MTHINTAQIVRLAGGEPGTPTATLFTHLSEQSFCRQVICDQYVDKSAFKRSSYRLQLGGASCHTHYSGNAPNLIQRQADHGVVQIGRNQTATVIKET